MSSRHLLLSQKGLFCFSFQQGDKIQKGDKKRNLIEALRFTCSTCYIARNLYWEHIVHYPTTNLFEVHKIVQAEVVHIAPIDGKTCAYIVNSSNNRTTVLYCCFPEKMIDTAKHFNLWRILPETLPYYRYLFGKAGIYLAKVNFSALNSDENKVGAIVDEVSPCSELLIKSDTELCSSLPVDRNNLDVFSVAMMEEATVIEKDEAEIIFNKFNLLNVVDFAAQAIEGITGLVNKKGDLARYMATVFIAFLLTFIIGKSAFITWHTNYLTEKVAGSKSAAVGSLKLSNELKKIKKDINKINTSVALQVPKAQLLTVLSSLVNKGNDLVFSTIDISPAEMQLRGISNNSANLLTTLSNIYGFNQVEFNSPPVTLKQGGERFFIKLRFDESIKKYQAKVNVIVEELDQ